MHILYIIQYCDYNHFTFSGNSIVHKSTRTLQTLCWMAWISQVQSIQLPSIFLKARPWGVAITMKCRAMCLHGLEEWLSPWSTGLCVYMALRCGYHHEVQGYVFTFYSLYYFFLLSTLCPHFFPSKTKSCHSIYMYTVDNRNWGSVWIVIFGSHIKTSSMAIRMGGGGGGLV